MTAKENVEFALELASRDGSRPKRDATTLLKIVGLEERLNHFPAQLSGGEQQRVAVAQFRKVDKWDIVAIFSQNFSSEQVKKVKDFDGVRKVQVALMVPAKLEAKGNKHEGPSPP